MFLLTSCHLQRFYNDDVEADDYSTVEIGGVRISGSTRQADETTCRLPVDCSGCFSVPVDKDQRRYGMMRCIISTCTKKLTNSQLSLRHGIKQNE